MPKIINLLQGSQEWHAYRKDRIGASDAPIIFDMNPWRTTYSLWEEKLGLCDSSKMNANMRRGHELEPIARKNCEELLGISINPIVLEDSNTNWRFASYDGISDDHKTIIEIKCPKKGLHDIVPEYYMPQLQHQMYVAEVNTCFYYSFDGKKGKMLEIKRDDEYIQKLLIKEQEFYKCMINFEPPVF